MSEPRIRYAEAPLLLVLFRCGNCLTDVSHDDDLMICPVCGTAWPENDEIPMHIAGGELYDAWSKKAHPVTEVSGPVDGIRARVEWEQERRDRIVEGVLKRLEQS